MTLIKCRDANRFIKGPRLYAPGESLGAHQDGQARLKWMDYYKAHGKNAALTCRYFGISRQTSTGGSDAMILETWPPWRNVPVGTGVSGNPPEAPNWPKRRWT